MQAGTCVYSTLFGCSLIQAVSALNSMFVKPSVLFSLHIPYTAKKWFHTTKEYKTFQLLIRDHA